MTGCDEDNDDDDDDDDDDNYYNDNVKSQDNQNFSTPSRK
jgi:hypothetical protein